jgi:hypothetical protein
MKHLPERPNLDHLEHQAGDLFRAYLDRGG